MGSKFIIKGDKSSYFFISFHLLGTVYAFACGPPYHAKKRRKREKNFAIVVVAPLFVCTKSTSDRLQCCSSRAAASQFAPTTSVIASRHLLLVRPRPRFPSQGRHSAISFGQRSSLILAILPAQRHFLLSTHVTRFRNGRSILVDLSVLKQLKNTTISTKAETVLIEFGNVTNGCGYFCYTFALKQ
jgi:hypothetical protein